MRTLEEIFDSINENISYVDNNKWNAIVNAYDEYLSTGNTYDFDHRCKDAGLKSDDVMFWFKYIWRVLNGKI